MDQIRDLIGRIAELSDEELSGLSDSIVAEFESVEQQDLSQQVVEAMSELASAFEAVQAETSRRDEEVKELSRLRDEAAARVKGTKEADTAAEDSEPDAQPITEAAIETPAETDAVSTVAELATEEVEATVASGETIPPALPRETDEVVAEEAAPETEEVAEAEEESAEEEASEDTDNGEDSEAPVTAAADQGPDVQAPADRRPREATRVSATITAGADIPGVTMGSDLPSFSSIADAMLKRMHGMRRSSGGDGEQHTVASIVTSFPEDRVLRAGEAEANKVKIDKVASPEAIIAAGGFCAPIETDYTIMGWGVTNRPVRDSLATFNADRGGIRWVSAPVLGDIPTYDYTGSDSISSMSQYQASAYPNGAAVSVWNIAADEDAVDGSPVKPCFRIQCGTEEEAYLEAVPVCLTIGNLVSRAFPELVEANNNLALVTQARFAEQRLLRKIGALSTQVTAAQTLGASRDFFNQVDRAAVAYRHRHRLDEKESLRVIVPTWLKNLIRADLVLQMPGDGQDETFALADSVINNWFAIRNINVTWTIDGEAGQYFSPQGNGTLVNYPSTVIWYLFAEGTFLFLDGGTLDLGLVRDSTLNATNDYKMFVETFEGVAKRGIESLRVTSTLSATGHAAALA